MTKKKTKDKIIVDATALSIYTVSSIACDVTILLEQYNTSWMPKPLRDKYEKLKKDAHELNSYAYDLSNIEVEP